ncbi:MAG TPA: hypothetical protein VFA60_07190 [Terriglobales bacterium]|nr:hypothetical protein [Terriglobales bacterium]
MFSRWFGPVLLLSVAAVAFEQAPTPLNQNDTGDLGAYLKKQFGPGFAPAPLVPRGAGGVPIKGAPTTVLLTGDLDGDGAEDAVILVSAKNPLAGQQDYKYKVIDPYDAYYGWGNPKETQQFASSDPDRARTLVVIHNWRAAEAKAKFVIINLPFDRLTLAQVVIKKKPRVVINADEAGLMISSVYWDGKKYKYEPGTAESEK